MKVRIKRTKRPSAGVKITPNELNAERIEITSPFIRLDSLLKFAAIAGTGGEAKTLIQDGLVSVNGEVCVQRGKKIYPGDAVKMAEGKISLTVEAPPAAGD